MITNREAIYLFRKFGEDTTGRLSDDSGSSNKAILEFLRMVRASVVKNYIELGKDLSPQLFQTIPCIELMEADKSDCPIQPRSGCRWLKTKDVLPTYLHLSSVSSGLSGDTNNFSHRDWDKIVFKSHSRVIGDIFTTKDIGKGTHLYIHNEDFLKTITVSAIFENTVEAAAICDKDCRCDLLDQSFYADRDMMNVIMTEAWSKIPQIRRLGFPDIFNNSGPDSVVTPASQ